MFRTHTTGRSNQMRAAGVGTATRSQLQTQTFLQDAFNQLDEVLKRKRALATAEEDGADRAQFSAAEIKASQQMIQRWLVIFAREHLPDICEKLMACAEEQRRAGGSTGKQRGSVLPRQQLPNKSDEPESINEHRDNSALFFILESLRRVLSSCAQLEGGGGSNLMLRQVPEALLQFCFEHIHVSSATAVRHVASECVGLLSRAHLKAALELFLVRMKKLANDRDEREYVPYQRATRLLELSMHSAEQASSSLLYLKELGAMMARTSRGVLRAEICSSLLESLARLMTPSESLRRQEWHEYCTSAGTQSAARDWWGAYQAVYAQLQRWAKKPSHSVFCYELMVGMISLACAPSSGEGGLGFADSKRQEELLRLLAAALKKETMRAASLPLAASFVASLPAPFLQRELATASTPLRLLVQAHLPRRHTPDASEAEATARMLLRLGEVQPRYVLGLIVDGLSPSSTTLSRGQRALLLRVLSNLAVVVPAAVAELRETLRPLLTPIVHVKEGGDDGPLLSAALLCMPHVWSDATGERERDDLQRIANLITSNSRELSHSASLCLQTLMEMQPLRLMAPVLLAIARMVLRCNGARATQLQRALSIASFLTTNAMEALPEALAGVDDHYAAAAASSGADASKIGRAHV